MKQNTKVWVKMESSGRPADTLILNATTREIIMAVGKWILETYMGNHMTIRLARTEAELSRTAREIHDGDMMAELESLVFGETRDGSLGDDNDTSSYGSHNYDQSPQCPHGTRLTQPCLDCRREHQTATM